MPKIVISYIDDSNKCKSKSEFSVTKNVGINAKAINDFIEEFYTYKRDPDSRTIVVVAKLKNGEEMAESFTLAPNKPLTEDFEANITSFLRDKIYNNLVRIFDTIYTIGCNNFKERQV